MSSSYQAIDRRAFLKQAGLSGAAAALVTACDGSDSPTSDVGASKPNIVLIMADDMGFSDIACYGGEISTPNLDALAANGVRFKNFYNAARCCPTRASLMTGLYPHQTGVGHMTGRYTKDGEVIPSYQGDLNTNCVTIAEALKPAGYTTLMSGKWHVTPAVDPDKVEPEKHNRPRQRGYDRFFGTILGAGSFYDPVTLTRENEPIEPETENFYYTTAIGDNAISFIEESPRDRPFFLYMSFTSPHWPLHAPAGAIEKYKGKYDMGWDALREQRRRRMINMGIIDESWPLTERDTSVPPWEDAEHKEWEARRMEVYAAQVSVMDETIGRFVDKLREMDQLANTLMLFLADNGGCAEELDATWSAALYFPERTLDGERPVQRVNDPNVMPGPEETYQSYGVPWANASNTPFRLYKHYVHEGGIASPFIMHWPDRLKNPGTWTDEPGHLIDVMATCLDAAGGSYPSAFNGNAITPLEGISLVPVVEGGAAEDRDAIYWEHEGNRAIRSGKWKLVAKWRPPENNRWELYDLEADRVEMNDLSAENPELVKELSAKWDAWADKVGVIEWRSWDSAS